MDPANMSPPPPRRDTACSPPLPREPYRPALQLSEGVWCEDVACGVCGAFLGVRAADGSAAAGHGEWLLDGGPRCHECAPEHCRRVSSEMAFHAVPLAIPRVRDAVAWRELGPTLDCHACGAPLADSCYAFNFSGYGTAVACERSAGPAAYVRDRLEGTVFCEGCAVDGDHSEDSGYAALRERVALTPEWCEVA